MKHKAVKYIGLFLVLMLFSANLYAASGDTIVYVTDYGEKYHEDGCGSLWKSKNKITLKKATDRGYEPCAKCDPPILDSSTKTTSSDRLPSNLDEALAQREKGRESPSSNSTSEALIDENIILKSENKSLKKSNELLKEALVEARENTEPTSNTSRLFVSLAVGICFIALIVILIQKKSYSAREKTLQEKLSTEVAGYESQIQALREITQGFVDTNRKLRGELRDLRRLYLEIKASADQAIPDGIIISEKKLPISEDFNEKNPYGIFTVFRSINGKKAHLHCGCCGAKMPLHRYDAISKGLALCSKCWEGKRSYKVDSWYLNYRNICEADQLVLDLEKHYLDNDNNSEDDF